MEIKVMKMSQKNSGAKLTKIHKKVSIVDLSKQKEKKSANLKLAQLK